MYARTRIQISGVVQGVFFRREVARLAKDLDVSGWVRNLPDGKVEVVAEGDKQKLNELVQYCRIGPSRAQVKDVGVEWSDYKGEFRGFKITH